MFRQWHSRVLAKTVAWSAFRPILRTLGYRVRSLPLVVSALNSFGDSGFNLSGCQTQLFGVLMGFGSQLLNSVTLIGSHVANGSVNGCFNGHGACFVNVISNFSWQNADVQRKPRPIRISMVFKISQKLWLSQGLNIAMPYEL